MVDKYLNESDLSGRIGHFLGLRKKKLILFVIISVILYFIYIKRYDPYHLSNSNEVLRLLQSGVFEPDTEVLNVRPVEGNDSKAETMYGYRLYGKDLGISFCKGDNCKAGDCVGEECEASYCYGQGCHAGDCYGKGCIPGKCEDTKCVGEDKKNGVCKPYCFDGRAYHIDVSTDHEIRKKFPDGSLFYNSVCGKKLLSKHIKNKKHTWNFDKKTATFYTTGTKTVTEMNRNPPRQAGKHFAIVDERNVYSSNPYMFQNNNCEWCAKIKGYNICSSFTPQYKGKKIKRLEWIPDKDEKCDMVNINTGSKQECTGNTVKTRKYMDEEIDKIMKNRRKSLAEKYYDIEELKGDAFVSECLTKKMEEQEPPVRCERLFLPRCLPTEILKGMVPCVDRIYLLKQVKKFDKAISRKYGKKKDSKLYPKTLVPIDYVIQEPDTEIPDRFFNARKWEEMEPYYSISNYTTFRHHLPIYKYTEGFNQIYECYFCKKTCTVKNSCLPLNKRGQIAKCLDNREDHHMVQMQDTNGYIYNYCVKCKKECPKIGKRSVNPLDRTLIYDVIFTGILFFLIFILLK